MINFIINFLKATWYSIMSFFGFNSNRSIRASDSLHVYVRTNVGEQVSLVQS